MSKTPVPGNDNTDIVEGQRVSSVVSKAKPAPQQQQVIDSGLGGDGKAVKAIVEPTLECTEHHSTRSARSATLIAFLVLFGGLFVWIMLAELDYGVHAVGKLVNRFPSIPIQHDTRGRIKTVAVVDGQRVQAGDTLVVLEDAQALADAAQAESQWLVAQLQYDGVLIEQQGSGEIPFPHSTLGVLRGDVLRQAHMEASQGLKKRLEVYQEQLEQLNAEERSLLNRIDSLSREIELLDEEAAIIAQRVENMRPLVTDNLLSRDSLDELRMHQVQLHRSQVAKASERRYQEDQRIDVEKRRQIFLAEREERLRGQMLELQPQLRAAEKRIAAVARQLEFQVIRAATDGQVINLQVRAAGEVISPGMELMELVPNRREFYIEARVRPQEIEDVHMGMPADIRFTTLPVKSTPYIAGKMIAVASDSVVDEKTGEEYYNVSVDFEGNVSEILGIEPTLGMPVDVMLRGGRRTVASYLIEPFRAILRRSMRES